LLKGGPLLSLPLFIYNGAKSQGGLERPVLLGRASFGKISSFPFGDFALFHLADRLSNRFFFLALQG